MPASKAARVAQQFSQLRQSFGCCGFNPCQAGLRELASRRGSTAVRHTETAALAALPYRCRPRSVYQRLGRPKTIIVWIAFARDMVPGWREFELGSCRTISIT